MLSDGLVTTENLVYYWEMAKASLYKIVALTNNFQFKEVLVGTNTLSL